MRGLQRFLPLACALALAFPAALMAASPATPASAPLAGKAAGPLDAFIKGVHKTVLPNGLTVLVSPQKGTGVVAINTWVKAGYFNEADEIAGMAHLFEHMFFKGSKNFPGAEQISQELARVGGQTNAGTIYDSTNYYFVVPREGFRRAAEIQADAIMSPLFDPAELKKEAEVVIEESNRKYDNAGAVSLERMFATAYTQHRMKRWRIGSNEVLRSINRDNLMAFFETVYRPENMVLSIAGDVTPAEALAVAQETFGKLAKGTLDKKYGPKEPAQTAFRFGQSAADLKQGYSVFGWHTPGVGHADELALDVLADILGSGRSSRLFTRAVGQGAAATATAEHYTFDDIGMLFIQASFDEKNRAEVERRAVVEVERMKAHGPTAFELQLAKNRIESSLVVGLQTALGQAQSLAQYEARHGYQYMAERLAKLQALTPAQIQDAARRYLRVDNLTLYHYQPKGSAPVTAEAALAAVQKAAAAGAGMPAETPVALPAAGKAVAQATQDGKLTEGKLANGVRLVVQERSGAPLVSASVLFKGGRTDETSRNAGITQLMARSLRKGTKTMAGEEVDRQIEFLGSQFNLVVDADFFGYSIDILGRNAERGMGLLADVLRQPAFPDKGVQDEKAQQLAMLKRNLDSSTVRPVLLAMEAYYEGHPYGLPATGYASSLADLGPAELRAWHAARVNADDALIVMVGDISFDAARKLAEANFAWLPKRAAARPALAPATPLAARKDVLEYRDRKQSAIVYAFPTVPRTHADWPAVRLLGNVTSGLSGTFFNELRSKQSLAYTVNAGDNSRAADGLFVAYLATDAKKEETAKTALLAEIRKMAKDEFDTADVERAKAYFSGATRIARQTNAALARDYAVNAMFGLPLNFTDQLLEKTARLGLDDLRAVSAKYLSGDVFVGAIQKGKP